MSELEILDEIASIGFLRVQKISELFNSTLTFECYTKLFKRIFLVFDHNPKTRSFHFQLTRLQGFKTQSLFTLLLKKYVQGKLLQFVRLAHVNAIRANFVHEGVNYALIFELKPVFAVGLVQNDNLIGSFKKNVVPTLSTEQHHPFTHVDGLQANFARAQVHEDSFSSFHHAVMFSQQLDALKRDLKKAQKLLANVRSDRKKCEAMLAHEHEAELIRANLHCIKRGINNIIVMDYFSDPPTERTISVDPSMSAKEFLEKSFSKIKRAKRGLGVIDKRIEEIEQNVHEKERRIADFIARGQLDDLVAKPTQASVKKRVQKRLPYRVYVGADNTTILVGRSAKDSDELTLHHAKGNDWWFHARDVPGAHVVVRSSNQDISQATLLDAALLAAHFSDDRASSRASVQYTRVKYVRKPKGFAPGKVLISQERSMDVVIDKNRLTELLAQLHQT